MKKFPIKKEYVHGDPPHKLIVFINQYLEVENFEIKDVMKKEEEVAYSEELTRQVLSEIDLNDEEIELYFRTTGREAVSLGEMSLLIGKPKVPSIEEINITKYVRWDMDNMVKTLQKEVGWTPPKDTKLPMRFDCEIEDSFINHSYKTDTGLTCHGIICNNLIYDGIRTKNQLKKTVEYYDRLVKHKKEELMIRLGLK